MFGNPYLSSQTLISFRPPLKLSPLCFVESSLLNWNYILGYCQPCEKQSWRLTSSGWRSGCAVSQNACLSCGAFWMRACTSALLHRRTFAVLRHRVFTVLMFLKSDSTPPELLTLFIADRPGRYRRPCPAPSYIHKCCSYPTTPSPHHPTARVDQWSVASHLCNDSAKEDSVDCQSGTSSQEIPSHTHTHTHCRRCRGVEPLSGGCCEGELQTGQLRMKNVAENEQKWIFCRRRWLWITLESGTLVANARDGLWSCFLAFFLLLKALNADYKQIQTWIPT